MTEQENLEFFEKVKGKKIRYVGWSDTSFVIPEIYCGSGLFTGFNSFKNSQDYQWAVYDGLCPGGWNFVEGESKKEMAARFNSGKLEFLQCPTNAMAAISAVFMRNSKSHGGKYENFNWTKGAPQTQYIECALRHLYLHAAKQDIDDDSQLPHLFLALTNLAMATEMYLTRPDLDDRRESSVNFKYFMDLVKQPRPEKK